MPLPQRWHKKKQQQPPDGFDVIEPTLEALEHELRDKIKETNEKKRKTESMWPVYQINWQKSRYVYDMYYTYHRISKAVYDYCIQQKLIDAALIAKWKKPGYERLCSTYVINPSNYKFGTTSICRVPLWDRSPEAQSAQDPTTGCLGCASGKGAGPRNIFGNKYGQYLAAVQIAREERIARLQAKKEAEAKLKKSKAKQQQEDGDDSDSDDDSDASDSDDSDDDSDKAKSDDDDDDYGPTPAAGVWAGSQKLQDESNQMLDRNESDDDDDGGGKDESDRDEDDEGPALPPAKKVRQH